MNDKIELLPCPFCGSAEVGDEHVQTYSVDSSYDTFGCRTCGAVFVDGGHREWNRRASKPEAQGVAYFVADAYGGYWQTTVDGKPYNFRVPMMTPALSTPASHDAQQRPNVDVQAEARRILADDYRRAGYMGAMDDALDDDPSPHCKVTLKAIERALAQQPAVVGDGVDLQQFRQAVVHWYADADNANTNPEWARGEAERLLAIIDTQAALTPAATPGSGHPMDARYEVPPCLECGAVSAEDAETKCNCSGDKDDCHGCYLWDWAAQKEGNGNG